MCKMLRKQQKGLANLLYQALRNQNYYQLRRIPIQNKPK